MTYSITGWCPRTKHVGLAMASFDVLFWPGTVVGSAVQAGAGAVTCQAQTRPGFGEKVLERLKTGRPAAMPGGGIVFTAGGLLDPVWGIPAPVMVGVTAAVAESFGELTGYGAGRGGSTMLREHRLYRRVRAWIERRPFTTVLTMSLFPSPVFDVAGLAAGAARVPLRTFYPALLAGKVVRGIAVATMGYYSIGLINRLLF